MNTQVTAHIYSTEGGGQEGGECTDKRSGSGRSEGDVERDGSSNQRVSGRMWTHKEVCCHGHQCGLFFFWMPLTACRPRSGIRLP